MGRISNVFDKVKGRFAKTEIDEVECAVREFVKGVDKDNLQAGAWFVCGNVERGELREMGLRALNVLFESDVILQDSIVVAKRRREAVRPDQRVSFKARTPEQLDAEVRKANARGDYVFYSNDVFGDKPDDSAFEGTGAADLEYDQLRLQVGSVVVVVDGSVTLGHVDESPTMVVDGFCNIPDSNGGCYVSRTHCHISSTYGSWYVRDASSKNGTAVNGEPLSANESRQISTGDVIQLASVCGPRYWLEVRVL